jgi:hypothetical protein
MPRKKASVDHQRQPLQLRAAVLGTHLNYLATFLNETHDAVDFSGPQKKAPRYLTISVAPDVIVEELANELGARLFRAHQVDKPLTDFDDHVDDFGPHRMMSQSFDASLLRRQGAFALPFRRWGGGRSSLDSLEITTYNLYCFAVAPTMLDRQRSISEYPLVEDDLLLVEQIKENPTHPFLRPAGSRGGFRAPSFSHPGLRIGGPTPRSQIVDLIQTFYNYIVDFDALSAQDFTHRSWTPLQALLLYTDQDEELSLYVREHFLTLSDLAGHIVDVFFLEDVSTLKGIGARDFWKNKLELATYKLYRLFGFDRCRPYDKTWNHAIAELLGIEKDRFPCLVLLRLEAQRTLSLAELPKIVITVPAPAHKEDYKFFFRTVVTIIDKHQRKQIKGRPPSATAWAMLEQALKKERSV